MLPQPRKALAIGLHVAIRTVAPDDLCATNMQAGDLCQAGCEPKPNDLRLPSASPVSWMRMTIIDISLPNRAVRGLAKITRHAYTSQVWAKVAMENYAVIIGMRDNGIGMKTKKVNRPLWSRAGQSLLLD